MDASSVNRHRSGGDNVWFFCARYYLSHGLGILDALIGQMAVALNLPMHTFNQRHYAAIPNHRATLREGFPGRSLNRFEIHFIVGIMGGVIGFSAAASGGIGTAGGGKVGVAGGGSNVSG